MEKNYTARLIRTFFESNISKEAKTTFQRWFINNEAFEEKQSIMKQLWNEIDACPNETTYRELIRLKKRIRAYDQTKQPLYIQFLKITAIVLFLLIGAFSAYFLKKESVIILEPQLTEHFVPYGEREQIILPDSSEVWLNAGSVLLYEKEFKGATRSVYLIGEASFTIKKDIHPFIVKTKEINVEVLGTVFNVQSYMNDVYSITTLEEGKVKINTNEIENEPIFLLPNEQLIFNKNSKSIKKKSVEATKQSLWKQGYLFFQSSDFNYMMNTIERRFNVKINYSPEKFKDRSFTVKFSSDEDLNQIFELLKKVCGFEYKIRDNVIYITN